MSSLTRHLFHVPDFVGRDYHLRWVPGNVSDPFDICFSDICLTAKHTPVGPYLTM